MSGAPSSPTRYDKFTYAVKRRPESATASPSANRTLQAGHGQRGGAAHAPGLAALVLNRDGFAISEDGTLVSRIVSPPRWTPNCGSTAVGITSSAPTTTLASSAAPAAGRGPSATPKKGTPSRGGTAKSPSSAQANVADPWGKLVAATADEINEEELATLNWPTVQGLLDHYGLAAPISLAKAQLAWREKNKAAGGSGSSVMGGDDDVSLLGGDDEQVLMYTAPVARLQTAPIQQIAYGRPASPRPVGKFVPDRKKPLNWTSGAKIDTGLRR